MSRDLTVDLAACAERRAELRAYFETKVDDGHRLVCMFSRRCRESVGLSGFAEGQLSHLGSHYEISDSGRPLRVLMVPMQRGRDDEHITMEQRAEQVESGKPLSARPKPRTQQMDGTALALKVLRVIQDARTVLYRCRSGQRSSRSYCLLNNPPCWVFHLLVTTTFFWVVDWCTSLTVLRCTTPLYARGLVVQLREAGVKRWPGCVPGICDKRFASLSRP